MGRIRLERTFRCENSREENNLIYLNFKSVKVGTGRKYVCSIFLFISKKSREIGKSFCNS